MKIRNIIIILISCVSVVAAQADTPTTLLTYLPDDCYSQITCFSPQIQGRTLPEKIKIETGIRYPEQLRALPACLRTGIVSSLVAVPASLSVVDRQETLPDGTIKILNRKCAATFQLEGHHYGAYLSHNSPLVILAYDNLNEKLLQARQAGVILPIAGRGISAPLFYLKKGNSTTIACKGGENILLLSTDLRSIKKMLRAQRSCKSYSIHNQAHFLINEAIDQECYLWSLSMPSLLEILIEEHIYKASPASDSLEIIQREIQNKEVFSFTRLKWLDSGYRKQETLTLFHNQESAAMGMKTMDNKPVSGLELIPARTYYNSSQVSYRGSLRAINLLRRDNSGTYKRVVNKDRIVEEVLESPDLYLASLKAAVKALPDQNH